MIDRYQQNKLREGKPLASRGITRGHQKAAIALSNIRGIGGVIVRYENDIPTIIAAGAGQDGYPWGKQWGWGFEFLQHSGVDYFRVHNTAIRVGATWQEMLVGDPVEGYAETSISSEKSGEWGVVVDVDWASNASRWGATIKILAGANLSKPKMYTHPDAPGVNEPPDYEHSYERIPIAWFNKLELVRDYIHSFYSPQIWAP